MSATKRQKTYAGKLSSDKDLSTPKHDEIVMWAMANMEKILDKEKHFAEAFECLRKEIQRYSTFGEHNVKRILGHEDYQRMLIELQKATPKCIVEYPVKSIAANGGYAKNAKGFMDLVIYSRKEDHPDLRNKMDYKMDNNGFSFTRIEDAVCLYIEVKSVVPSFGEIMRELQFYHTSLERVEKKNIALLCPPTQFADLIRAQGFTVIEYKPE